LTLRADLRGDKMKIYQIGDQFRYSETTLARFKFKFEVMWSMAMNNKLTQFGKIIKNRDGTVIGRRGTVAFSRSAREILLDKKMMIIMILIINKELIT
jgi:hypothetical protein